MSTKTIWVVMKSQPWSSVTIDGRPIGEPEDGPCGFLPVFKTKGAAIAWAGSEEHVVKATATEGTP